MRHLTLPVGCKRLIPCRQSQCRAVWQSRIAGTNLPSQTHRRGSAASTATGSADGARGDFHRAAANDNPGSEAGAGTGPEARFEDAAMRLARLLGRPIAREQFRQSEADMVRRDAAELRAKLPDNMTEFERPGRVAVHEHDWLAFAFVDEVHPVSRRSGEGPALKGV